VRCRALRPIPIRPPDQATPSSLIPRQPTKSLLLLFFKKSASLALP
jgi:hypothetical protein